MNLFARIQPPWTSIDTRDNWIRRFRLSPALFRPFFPNALPRALDIISPFGYLRRDLSFASCAPWGGDHVAEVLLTRLDSKRVSGARWGRSLSLSFSRSPPRRDVDDSVGPPSLDTTVARVVNKYSVCSVFSCSRNKTERSANHCRDLIGGLVGSGNKAY